MSESREPSNAVASSVNSSMIAFIFPGQGSQAVGMGKDLAANHPIARETFEEADEALGYKLSEICFEGPEEQLRLTEMTQPAILTVSIAALRVIAGENSPAVLRGRPQPGRIFRACGFGHDELCRRGARGAQSRKIYAGGGAGGSGSDGGHSRHGTGKSCRGLPGRGAGRGLLAGEY